MVKPTFSLKQVLQMFNNVDEQYTLANDDGDRYLLAKVCPFIQMCQAIFKLRCTPNENLAVVERCVPFSGRVKFLQFNKVCTVLYC